MSSTEISGILENSKELDRIRKEQEDVLVEINKMHKKLQASEISSFNSSIQIKKKKKNWNLSSVFIFWYLGLMGIC